MKDLLPEWLYNHLFQNYELEKIQEIRIRKNQPIQICYKGKMIELRTNSGLYLKPLCATSEIIDYIISGATKQSLYAFDDQIKNGYIVTNYHVIENAKSINIQGINGDFSKQYNAIIVATDKYNDLALLADLMGHESIETTRIYLRKTANEQQEIVDKIITW